MEVIVRVLQFCADRITKTVRIHHIFTLIANKYHRRKIVLQFKCVLSIVFVGMSELCVHSGEVVDCDSSFSAVEKEVLKYVV